MPWTRFMDMNSGGGQKLEWPYIYIEAPIAEAEVIFYNRFGRNPNRVTCTCCGEDYSITEIPDDPEHNGWDLTRHLKEDQRYGSEKSLMIPSSEIKPEEREGNVPEEGYVWT